MKIQHRLIIMVAVLAVVVSLQSLVFTDGSPAPVPVMSMPIDVGETLAGGAALVPSLIAEETSTLVTIGSFIEQNALTIMASTALTVLVGISLLTFVDSTNAARRSTYERALRFTGTIDAKRALAGGDC